MRTLPLVEDDDAFRYAACRHLIAAGFHVVAVPTTVDALTEIDAGLQVDAFVIDLVMPPGNPHGMSFALSMRDRLPDAPMLFVTAFSDSPKIFAPPGKILLKPIDLDRLTAEIQALFPPSP
jgi:CheY-like chemotaxis protein